ncbi:MAG: hypothetical protein CVV64_15660 [Candidatus Wallbacteria bacterium HGW-Wallbacteria-1]|jgi:CysZ protein|uniref:Coproporphyrinogen III oxidase n=1 Tax=Candidatus Wallbacteria bacterium HGW-Wallbacteria-1 TaxID=2013854 RepID=A0A2N1PLI9_9BACT|nr:MAG: hypothetical protein CVV64_15660 [Candidatus Wallbacteria bacterium HGW-Wallbacteria-1]
MSGKIFNSDEIQIPEQISFQPPSGAAYQMKLALRSLSEAFSYMGEKKMWGSMLIPGLVSLLIAMGSLWAGIGLARITATWLTAAMGQGFLGSTIAAAAAILAFCLAIIAYLLLYKNLTLIILSPWMALLAERVYTDRTGRQVPFSAKQTIVNIIRSFRLNIRNLITELIITLPLMVLGTIPLFTLPCAVVVITVQSYFMGFGLMDYTLEMAGFNSGTARVHVWKAKYFCSLSGVLFLGLLMIPVLGLFIAPPIGVVATSLGAIELLKRTDQ